MNTVTELRTYRELFFNLTLRELRGKYKRSVLGWAWSLLNPVAQMGVYTLVFGYFLKVEPPTGDPSGLHVFAFFLLCGLLPWFFMANSLTAGMGSLLANANLVKKVWFPRQLIVGSNVASWLVSFFIELGVLSVALMFAGNFVLPWLLPALGIVAIEAMFVMGLTLFFAVCSVYLRDLNYLVGIFLQMWFYATPIVYPLSWVQTSLADKPVLLKIYEANPMMRFGEVFRDLLYSMRWPALGDVLYLLACSVISLTIGWWTFVRLDGRLAEEL